MNEYLSIILSIVILSIFIVVIDITKSIFNKNYKKKTISHKNSETKYKESNEECDELDLYNIEEFKLIFMTTLIFSITLIFILHFFSGVTGFDIYHHFMERDLFDYLEILKVLSGGLFILILNSILFLGYLIQLIKRYEILSIEYKQLMLIIKENIYGPILEEVIYRGVIFNLLKSGGFTGSQSSIISSFLFGICNLIYLF